MPPSFIREVATQALPTWHSRRHIAAWLKPNSLRQIRGGPSKDNRLEEQEHNRTGLSTSRHLEHGQGQV
jgi:hypothetical protein